MPETPAHYSHTQLSKQCGLQVKFYRERIASDRVSISQAYGRALHAGLEDWANARIDGRTAAAEASLQDEIDFAIERAHLALGREIKEAEGKGLSITYDGEPRQKKDGSGPYASDVGNIISARMAEAMLTMHVRAYLKHAIAAGPVEPLQAERKFELKMSRPEGRVIKGTIDRIDRGGVLFDYKTSGGRWDEGKFYSYRPQAYIYHAAYMQLTGVPAKTFKFVVFAKGSPVLQEFEVPFDAQAINRHFELNIRPRIAAIEANIFVPNTEGWWCSEKFCDYWHHCPLGAAARGKSEEE